MVEPRVHRLGSDVSIDEMKDSLAVHGQLSPILVRKHPTGVGKYQVIFGNRRLAAARALGWKEIEANIADVEESESLVLAFAENSDRKDFSDYEKALILIEIHEKSGKSYKEISDLIGKSRAFVSQHVSMAYLFPESVASKAERDKVLRLLTENHARVLARIAEPEERWGTAKLAVSANLSVREIQKMSHRRHMRKTETGNVEERVEIQQILSRIIEGINTKNVEMFFSPSLSRDFTMFSRFPPLDRMDGERATAHMLSILKKPSKMKLKILNSEVRIFKEFALATMICNLDVNHCTRVIRTKSRATVVLTRDKVRGWNVLHEHWSSANPAEISNVMDVNEVDLALQRSAEAFRRS